MEGYQVSVCTLLSNMETEKTGKGWVSSVTVVEMVLFSALFERCRDVQHFFILLLIFFAVQPAGLLQPCRKTIINMERIYFIKVASLSKLTEPVFRVG